jgi:uncharacterized metal-binding protein
MYCTCTFYAFPVYLRLIQYSYILLLQVDETLKQRWALPMEVPVFRQYQIKKKISEYRTKLSIGLRLSDWQHLTSDVLIVSDFVKTIALKIAIGHKYI